MLVRRLAPESAARTRAAGNTDSSRKDCLASPDREGIASRHLPVQIVCQQTTTNWDPGHSGISLKERAPSAGQGCAFRLCWPQFLPSGERQMEKKVRGD